MFNTINTKKEQLERGFFETGIGKEVILIIGSCRTVPYINYLYQWNVVNGETFKIVFIDPFNWHFDLQDNRTNFEEVIAGLESHHGLLNMLKSVKYFIHEYYSNYGMFNCNKNTGKNIYDFGLSPEVDICLPNFNDLFILFADIVSFDVEIRRKAISDYNVIGKLSDKTEKEIFEISQRNLEKFYEVCRKSDLPQMEEFFKYNLPRKRLFWTSNHVSKHFTFAVFIEVIKRLGLEPTSELCFEILKEDMFANNFTYLTEYDIKWFCYDWGEEIKPLRNKL